MRHRKYKRKLGRRKDARRALFRGLVRSLFLNGKIETTEAKAKAIRTFADKLINIAIKGLKKRNEDQSDVHERRLVHSFFGKKDIVKHLFEEVAPHCMNRSSGWTRVLKTRVRRGDAARMALIEVIDYVDYLNKQREEEEVTEE